MASKQVTNRQKASGAVAATVETGAARLKEGITTAVANGGPEVAAAALVLARSAGARLTASAATLVAADEAHAIELADDAGLRVARDTAAGALYERLVGLRDALVGLYGATVPTAIGFAGPTPQDPVMMARIGAEVAKGLRRSGALPAPRYPRALIDPLAEAAVLDRLVGTLGTALAAVAEDVRQNQVTKTARDTAMAAHDRIFVQTADLLSALFAFAGEAELADRVRPSRRSPGRLASGEGDAEVEGAPVPVPDAGEVLADNGTV